MTLVRRRPLATYLNLLIVSLALSPAACKSSGGSEGTGGAAGGANGSGGVNGTGGATGSATFTINITQSTAVATVEIVTWSASVSIDSAVIDFGRDQTNFEFQAPVD